MWVNFNTDGKKDTQLTAGYLWLWSGITIYEYATDAALMFIHHRQSADNDNDDKMTI